MNAKVGEQLRQVRQERNVTLEEIALGTHIKLHYLQAIEAGDFNRLPSPVQAHGFMRAYASYLGLDPEPLLHSTSGEPDSGEVSKELDNDSAQQGELEPSPPSQSKEIFEEIGYRLRYQRELLGLSLEDVERHTHLRVHYLQALETGRLMDLPSSVQGRGMLKNYAEFLSLDTDSVLLRFADGLQSRLSERRPERPQPAVRTSKRRSFAGALRSFPTDFILGAILLLTLTGFVIWGALRVSNFRSSSASIPTMPSIADELLTEAQSTAALTVTLTEAITPASGAPETSNLSTPVPGEDSNALDQNTQPASPVELPANDPNRLVNISLSVHQRTWVRVTVDGEVEFEGRMLPGSAYTFSGDQQVIVLTGNGAALQVFFNDQDLGTMGIFGEVVNRVYTPEGLVNPTPTATLPSSATPTVTPQIQMTEPSTPTIIP
jgi:cytoskeleton protein RodZ